jgi:hypothetical protein
MIDALERGDLNFAEFGLLCWLECRANHRKTPPEFTGTLNTIADAVDWQETDEWLRQCLVRLRDGGWIDYEVRPGQRKPFVIRLLASQVHDV